MDSLKLMVVTLILTMGGGYHPLADSSLLPPKQKESDLSLVGNLSNILKGHFDENKLGEPTLPGTRISHQTPVGRGGCYLSKFKFAILINLLLVWPWNYESIISFFYKPKTSEIPMFDTFFGKIFNFGHVLLKSSYFEVQPCLLCCCDVIHWMFVLSLVWKEVDP